MEQIDLGDPADNRQYDIMVSLPTTQAAIYALRSLQMSNGHDHTETARAQAQVDLCLIRDKIQASRPENCGCLGFGGYFRTYNNIDGQAVRTWKMWCDCPEGLADKARYNQELQAKDAEATQRYIERVLGMVPAEMHSWTLRSWLQEAHGSPAVARRLIEWVDDPEAWLYLHGPAGVGKSGAAWPLLKEYISRSHSGAFVNVAQVLDDIRSKYGNYETMRTQEVNPWSLLEHCNMLVLDDLGAQRNTDWAIERLYALINQRHGENRRTIITSNHDPRTMMERFSRFDDQMGERVMSRVAGKCGEWVFALHGEDQRVVHRSGGPPEATERARA